MFKEIAFQNFPKALKTLENRLPKSAMLFNVLHLLQHGSVPSTISTRVHAFQGILEETQETHAFKDVFLVAVQFRETYKDYAFIISAPDSPTPEMITSFEEFVDWKLPICFCAVDMLFSKVVAELCAKHGKCSDANTCDFMTMSNSKAKEIQIRNPDPESLQIKELSFEDASLASKRWKYSQEGTEILMAEYIKHSGSAGVYFKNELVSWVVIFAVGSINALYTEEGYRGKGYGKLTMQKIAKVAGDKGLVPNVQIELGNNTSKRLMDSVGFVQSHLVDWVIYNP